MTSKPFESLLVVPSSSWIQHKFSAVQMMIGNDSKKFLITDGTVGRLFLAQKNFESKRNFQARLKNNFGFFGGERRIFCVIKKYFKLNVEDRKQNPAINFITYIEFQKYLIFYVNFLHFEIKILFFCKNNPIFIIMQNFFLSLDKSS